MKIGCIIILYNPNIKKLLSIIEIIKNQVEYIYIGDNSPKMINDSSNIADLTPNINYEYFNSNLGIAAAQNKGINYITKKKEEIDYLLFLDQDSLPDQDMVQLLSNTFQKINNAGFKVGGIGACPFNQKNSKPYKRKEFTITRFDKNIKEVSEIMSSSSLISLQAFKDVGYFDEPLFIDGVDHEWCWRASKIGKYKFYISEDIYFAHNLGEGDKFFLVRNVSIPSPFRVYYQYRNYIFLIKRSYVPLKWKMKNGLKYLIKLFYYTVFIAPQKIYLKNILLGLKDGFLTKK